MGILGGIFNNKEEEMQARIEDLISKLNLMNKVLKERKDKITSLENDIKSLQTEIENQNDKNSSQKKQIEILKTELLTYQENKNNLENELTQVKSRSFSDKQLEVLEKNLKENQKLISEYKSKVIIYEETIRGLKETITVNGLSATDTSRKIYNYKITTEDFFNSAKTKEIVENLKHNNIFYIDDIKINVFDEFLKNCKNVDEAKTKFLDFLDGKMDWDTKTFRKKGERIKKIFAKNRKFLIYANDNYLQFMDDLADFDMRVLYEEGFSRNLVIDLSTKKENYFNENTI